jgi:hypothetical protein
VEFLILLQYLLQRRFVPYVLDSLLSDRTEGKAIIETKMWSVLQLSGVSLSLIFWNL